MIGTIAASGRRRASSGGGGSGPANRNFDFDTSETQAFTHSFSTFEVGTSGAHQHAWITSPTRLGTGHAERMEVHNNSGDSNGSTIRALMMCYDTNEGGVTVGSVIGYTDVYWAWSSYLPTSGAGDANATVSSGFSQTTIPNYEHLFELHDRKPGNPSIGEVAPYAVMIRSNQLQFRQRCGTWTWNGSGYNSPSWNTGTAGTTGSNDQIPIPIVKSGGTNATFVMDTWIDIIFHVRFANDSSGVVELWARQAGQTFTTSPNLSVSGPTHRVVTDSTGTTFSSADYDSGQQVSGLYVEAGLYTGGNTWSDSSNGAHVHIMDEMRRYSTLAAATANWG